jgi:hypothetical protein
MRKLAWGLAIAGVAAIAVALVLAFTGNGGPLQRVIGQEPARTPFAFGAPTIRLSPLVGSPSKGAADEAAEQIREQLSAFYDAAFLNPDTWAEGAPDDIWEGFTQDAAAKAQADPLALTLGPQPRLERLGAGPSTLSMNVLFDAKKGPYAIFAAVTFKAAGTLRDGSTLEVVSRATFLFRVISGDWLVAGVPKAHVEMDSAPPKPKPSTGDGSPESSP